MSNITALTDLARLVGHPATLHNRHAVNGAAVAGLVAGLMPRMEPGRTSDLLGTVLALSARTRRMVQPRVQIDLDVFTPEGRRAVQVIGGHAH